MAEAEKQYAIECRKITKTFGKVIANDEIDLNVRYGEILALLGENGSGKTTLLPLLLFLHLSRSLCLKSVTDYAFCFDENRRTRELVTDSVSTEPALQETTLPC